MNYPTYMPGGFPAQAQPPYSPREPQGFSAVPQQVQPVTQQGQVFPASFQGLSNASRPVANREEAIGSAADFSGSLMVFPDITHNRVYIKRWNYATGSADFTEYAPLPPQENQPEEAGQGGAFASLQDFQDLQNLVENLKSEGEKLKAEIEKIKKPPASLRAVKKEKGEAANE